MIKDDFTNIVCMNAGERKAHIRRYSKKLCFSVTDLLYHSMGGWPASPIGSKSKFSNEESNVFHYSRTAQKILDDSW